jgi:hypothetical protein
MKGDSMKERSYLILVIGILIGLLFGIFWTTYQPMTSYSYATEAEYTPTPRTAESATKSKMVHFDCYGGEWHLQMHWVKYDTDGVAITDGSKMVTYDWAFMKNYLNYSGDNANGLVQELTFAIESMAKDNGDIPVDSTVTFGCSED